MIFYILGFIGIIITIITLLIRVMKGKKTFNILTILILFLSLASLGIGIKIGLNDLTQNSNTEDVAKTVNDESKDKESAIKDMLDVDVQTLVEPKSEDEEAIALGFFKFSAESLEKLKKEQTKGYPKYGEMKDEIKMMGSLLVDYGMDKGIIKNRKDVFTVKGSNDLKKYPDTIYIYNAEYTASTTFSFDNNNKLISTISSFDYTKDYTNEFKNIRDTLIKYYGQPTFQNAFLTPKDKFDESKDRNVTYAMMWASNKRAVMLSYSKNEKNSSKDKIMLDYSLHN